MRQLDVVDADVHPYPRTSDELREYMREPWRSRDFGENEPASSRVAQLYPSPHGHGSRMDALPPTGGPAASDPDFLRSQLLERAGVEYAVLIPLGPRPQVNPEHDLAVCEATNDWLAETWLGSYDRDDRFLGTLRVPTGDPDLAVREIERWAGHPKFVQVMLDPGHQEPLGQPRFHKVYEAAARNGMAMCFHPIKGSGMRFLTPVGFATYFMDQHSQLALICAAQLTSLVLEGVFEKVPELRFAVVEGGYSWAPPLAWRLDKYWAELKSEVPWLRKRPSEYIKEQVRLTTQPFEVPPTPGQVKRVLEWFETDEFLMFATDYPHWDADDPQWAALQLPPEMRDGVLRTTALRFYGLQARAGAHA